jgi:hypothetical protein
VSFGRCPYCEFTDNLGGNKTIIYGMQKRSVTFECQNCKLRWNITFYRIALVSQDEPILNSVFGSFLAKDWEIRGPRRKR